MKPHIDLTGAVFSRLTVLRYVGRSRWECQCECGVIHTAVGYDLKIGTTKSCGCYGIDVRRAVTATHQKTNTPEHRSWANMIQRCTNPNNTMYKRYGARGIQVCKRWAKFENFLADMGERPSPQHTLDRIDNDGNYEPTNCRWATRTEQSRNRAYVIRLEGKTLQEMATELGVKPHTLYMRYRRAERKSNATPKEVM